VFILREMRADFVQVLIFMKLTRIYRVGLQERSFGSGSPRFFCNDAKARDSEHPIRNGAQGFGFANFEHVLFYLTSKGQLSERSFAPDRCSGRPSWTDDRFTARVKTLIARVNFRDVILGSLSYLGAIPESVGVY
jgi:hypothetical protein